MRSLVVVLLACSLCEAVFQGQLTSRTSSVVHIDSCTASVLNSRYIVRGTRWLWRGAFLTLPLFFFQAHGRALPLPFEGCWPVVHEPG